jgi:AAA+ superfamily predicted ATPase
MGRARMDYETLQALIEVYRARASTDLLAILIDEAGGPEGRAAVLELLRSLSPETFFKEEFALVRRKACQFCINSADFELAERLVRGSERPEDRAMRALALHGLGRDQEAIVLYRQAIGQDPAMRNRELERSLGIRPGTAAVPPPAKVISLTTYSSRRDNKGSEERRDTPAEAFLDDFDDVAVTFSDVAGLDSVKAEIRRRIVLPYLKPSLFERYRQKPGGSLLLYGPPGCGKTLIARATAGESDARFLSVSPEEILDKYAGEAEKRLRVFFDEARSDPPAILFFDDFEVLAYKRQAEAETAPALISAILSELDSTVRNNSGVLVIAATNAPWVLDPALFRAGRFQTAIYVPPPSVEARKKILLASISGVPGHDKVALDRIARKSAGLSGADLRALADWVNNTALSKMLGGAQEASITAALFEDGLKAFGPSTLDWLAAARAALKPMLRWTGFSRLFSEVYRV